MEQKLETKQEEYKQTELGELPKEWGVVRLGDYCKLSSGYAFKSGDFVKDGVFVVKIGNLQNGTVVIDNRTNYFPKNKITGNVTKFILKNGDILIAMTGATTGKVAVVPKKYENSLLNQRVGKFDILSKELNDSFFRYFSITQEFQEKILGNILKSAQGNVSPKQIENIIIALPPLPEQQKIAYVLSTVQNAQEKTENFINSLKEFKKSAMKHLFTYGTVPFDEIDKVELKETEIGMMPKSWEVVKLGEQFILIRGPFGGSLKKEMFTKEGYAVYEQQHAIYNQFSDIRYFIDARKFEEMKRFELKTGNLIMSCSGTFGKIALVPDGIKRGVINQALLLLIPHKTIINTYFKHFVESEKFQKIIKSNTHGAAIKNVASIKILKNIKMFLPPITEQQKIASILSTIDEKIQAEEQKKKALKETFNSLLKNLMTAKIRVNNLEVGA